MHQEKQGQITTRRHRGGYELGECKPIGKECSLRDLLPSGFAAAVRVLEPRVSH